MSRSIYYLASWAQLRIFACFLVIIVVKQVMRKRSIIDEVSCFEIFVFLNFISEDEQQNLDAIAREKIMKFVLSLMGEYFKIVENRLELEVHVYDC